MRALLRQSRCCLRANPSALPGLERFAVPTRPLLRVPLLLRRDDGGTGAVQRHHLRGHDGPCPANRAARNRRLGGMVHHRGCRGVSPHAGTRLAIRLPEPGLWSWPDAARLRRAAAAALSVGVRGRADLAPPSANAGRLKAIATDARPALSLPGWRSGLVRGPSRSRTCILPAVHESLSRFGPSAAAAPACRGTAGAADLLAGRWVAEIGVEHSCGMRGAVVTQRGVFLRTPKVRTPSRLGRAVLGTLPETLVAAACAVMAVAVGLFGPHTLGLGVATLLVWQAITWGSAPAASLLAQEIPLTPARILFKRSPQTTGARPSPLTYRHRRLLVAAIVVVAAILLTPAIVTSPGADSSLQQAINAALPPVIAKLGNPLPSGSTGVPGTGPTKPPVIASPKPATSSSPSPSLSPSPGPLPSTHPTGPPTATASPSPSHPVPSPTPRPTR